MASGSEAVSDDGVVVAAGSEAVYDDGTPGSTTMAPLVAPHGTPVSTT